MLTTVTIGGRAADGSERTSQTVACDQCGTSLDPGERAADDAPWNDAQALATAETRGWWHGLDWRGRDLDLCAECLEVPLAGGAA